MAIETRLEHAAGRKVTRRTTLKFTLAAGAAFAAPAYIRNLKAAESLIIADPGGSFEMAVKKGFHEPFTKETGVEINQVARKANPIAQVKAMVETKSYDWDAVYVGNPDAYILGQQGLLEDVDQSGPDFKQLPEKVVLGLKYIAPVDVPALNNCYNKDKYGKNPPQGWADFWDVKKFPGRRAMSKRAHENAEVAMMADGVPPGPEIYKALSAPGGWDRFFKKMGEIRPHIAAWATSGSQTAQLSKAGEADMVSGFYNNHLVSIEDGAPYAIDWKQAFFNVGGYVIAKGNPKADLARKWCATTAKAERQAVHSQYIANGPANPEAFKYIDEARAKKLPTYPAYFATMFPMDVVFWNEWNAKANERFTQWLLT